MRNAAAGMLRSIFAFTSFLAVATVHGQVANVVAANSVNNNILGVTFKQSSGTTTVLNDDQGSLYSLTSLAFLFNGNTDSPSLDLLAADNQKGKVLRYVGDFSTLPANKAGTVVTTSITYPTGLSVDSAGDLFLVNDAPGHSPLPQVWVLPSNGSGGLSAAHRIDGLSSFGKLQATVETLIVGSPPSYQLSSLGSANPGDLLVLTTNPNTILRYPGSGLNGNGAPQGPLSAVAPTVLLGQCPSSNACIPAGVVPAGLAVWPADGSKYSNSLLISTQSGTILAYSLSGTPTQLANLSSGLPCCLYKIKTGYASGQSSAFVVQSGPGNHGSVVQLALNNPNNVAATVTSGVAAPEGIAVTNTVQAPIANCAGGVGTGGCDLLGGGSLKYTVFNSSGSLNSNLVETLCVVAQDPRSTGPGTCNGSTLTIDTATVCPGFDNTAGAAPMIIPANFCGASGPNKTGFALIKSLTPPDQFNNAYIQTEQNTDELFAPPAGPDPNPVCGNHGGTAMIAWAPLAGESLLAEEAGSNDSFNITTSSPSLAYPTLVDITDGCGSGKSGGPAVSVFAVGLALTTPTGVTPAMTSLGTTKYTNLLTTITDLTGNHNINPALPQLTNGTSGCFDVSSYLFAKASNESGQQQTADFQNAADLLANADSTGATTCDSVVTKNSGNFSESPSANPPVFNPSGQVRWRLANLYYTIETRILQLPAAGVWPPPVSVSTSVSPMAPQYVFAQCTGGAACPAPQSPSTGTVSWAVVSGASGCQWQPSSDPTFNPANPTPPPDSGTVSPVGSTTWPVTGPSPYPGNTYNYTLSCTVPAGTVPSTATTYSATTWLTVWPGVTVSSTSTSAGTNPVTVTWSPPAGATQCTLTSNGANNPLTGTTSVAGPQPSSPPSYQATYTPVPADYGNTVTFQATCTSGASFGTAQTAITAPPPPV